MLLLTESAPALIGRVANYAAQSPSLRGIFLCAVVMGLLHVLFGSPEDGRGTGKNLLVAGVVVAAALYLGRGLVLP